MQQVYEEKHLVAKLMGSGGFRALPVKAGRSANHDSTVPNSGLA